MTPAVQTQHYIQSNNYNSKEKNCPAFVHIQLLLWLNREIFFSYRSIRELNMEREFELELKINTLKKLVNLSGLSREGTVGKKVTTIIFSGDKQVQHVSLN